MKIVDLDQVPELISYGARVQIPASAIALVICFANRAHTSSVVDDILSADWLDRQTATVPHLQAYRSYLKSVGEEIRRYWNLDPALPVSAPVVPLAPLPPSELPPVSDPVTPSPNPDQPPIPAAAEPVVVPVTGGEVLEPIGVPEPEKPVAENP